MSDFGTVLEALKRNTTIARVSWQGRMYVGLAERDGIAPMLVRWRYDQKQGTVWVPTVEDMFATDWHTLNTMAMCQEGWALQALKERVAAVGSLLTLALSPDATESDAAAAQAALRAMLDGPDGDAVRALLAKER